MKRPTIRLIPTLRSEESFKNHFDGLDWSKEAWPPLDKHEIAEWCRLYLEYPKFRPDWRFVKLLMWHTLKTTSARKLSFTSQETAVAVDGWYELGFSLADAREKAAKDHEKSVDAATEAHKKHGEHKGTRGGDRRQRRNLA
jgi:hypothetical protein